MVATKLARGVFKDSHAEHVHVEARISDQLHLICNHTYLIEKSKSHKISPLNAFPLNFGCKIIFMCSANFWH